ncbi:MAG: GNAT family N-acetyltransferase [Chloroflexia bacterium]|nr:GNAT family N-acetyltransferase [Chloroflexia bacterium]
MDHSLTLDDGREVTIRTATECDAFGVLVLIDAVARERVYLLNTEAYWGVEGQREWIRALHRTGGTMLVTEAPEGALVAWADLARTNVALTRHTATLGTGVRAGWRDAGLGRALLQEITRAARELGIEKLELHVRSTNARAIHVYESLGWQHEGVGLRAYKQDGMYEDRVQMGLWLGLA